MVLSIMGCLGQGAVCIALAIALPLEPPSARREAPPPASPRNSKVTAAPAKAEPPAQPTAEDVLKALQHRRPVNEVIPPGSRAARDAVPSNATPSDRLLLPEGSSVVSRTGRLAHEGQWWIFTSDSDDSLPPTKLLPNANLEVIVRTLRGASAPIRFTVSGEVTVFEGENFLLPTSALRASGAVEPTGSTGPPRAAGETREAAAFPARPRPDASAADVLAALQAQQPKEVVLPSPGAGLEESGGERSAGYTPSGLLDGSPVINRVGRLVRQGSWWTFVSDSDRPDRADPALRLLPNQGVERMVKESQHRSGGVVFTVSGEVTLFEGENYLLPRVTTRRADTGNLRR